MGAIAKDDDSFGQLFKDADAGARPGCRAIIASHSRVSVRRIFRK